MFPRASAVPIISVGINTSQIFSLFERADLPSDMSWIFFQQNELMDSFYFGQYKIFQIYVNFTLRRDRFHAFDFEFKFKSTLDQLYCLYNLILPHTSFDFCYYKDYTLARIAGSTPLAFRQLLTMAIYTYAYPESPAHSTEQQNDRLHESILPLSV